LLYPKFSVFYFVCLIILNVLNKLIRNICGEGKKNNSREHDLTTKYWFWNKYSYWMPLKSR